MNRQELQKLSEKSSKMAVSTHLSIITLHVNRLNVQNTQSDWINKDTSVCYKEEIHFRAKYTKQIKVKFLKILHQHSHQAN